MDLKKVVNVKNRGTASVGYHLNDGQVKRMFAPGEVKKGIITVGELEQLTYADGGFKLLKKYLVINEPKVCEYLGLDLEPEYFYTEDDVKKLLLSGTLEQLLDCLDFAPQGVLDLIKKYAVELKINDIQKRQSIKDKLGFDVSSAIDNIEYSKATDANDGPAASSEKVRRARPIKEQTPVYERVEN
ncbi:MAG: hypothetical protein HUJ68_11930 [Clostridia bacterium]|nr:hypothetical protein [Clostridia bacterium]